MAKFALLIGVSEYGEGIVPLCAPPNDVKAMKGVLENQAMGGFDEVISLINPDSNTMRKAIQKLFKQGKKEDLILFYFSGHGLTDDEEHLYLSNRDTEKEYYQATSIRANFIQTQSRGSYCKRQILILDCCYSGAFKDGFAPRNIGLEIEKELGAEGRVVLTSSSATQKSFEQETDKLAVYTKYLVEGIATGAADKDGDGSIYISELHQYAKEKVQEVKPKMKPQIINDKEGFQILISKAPVNDPKLQYRKLVEKYAKDGKISSIGNTILQRQQQQLNISDSDSKQMIEEVLAPYRQYRENIRIYQQEFTLVVEQSFPLSQRSMTELQDLQDVLGLEDSDVKRIEKPIMVKAETKYQESLKVPERGEDIEIEVKISDLEAELGIEKEIQVLRDVEINGVRQQKNKQLKIQIPLGIQEGQKIRLQGKGNSGRYGGENGDVYLRLSIYKTKKLVNSPDGQLKSLEFHTVRITGIEKKGFFGLNKTVVNTQRIAKKAEYFTEDLGNGITLEMISIPEGKFKMGTDDLEIERLVKKFEWKGFRRESPQHEVTVQPFFMGKYPITQAQWKAIASLPKIRRQLKANPSSFKDDNRPVEKVSWYDAVEFCARLSQYTGKQYRLPSEAQWEYACRAGTTTPFYFGETITTDLANYWGKDDPKYKWKGTYADEPPGKYREKTTLVGQFSPNAFGLYDMHGNVWEWCADPYYNNYENAPNDGSVWDKKSNDDLYKNYLDNIDVLIQLCSPIVLRGGSWLNQPDFCRSADRYYVMRVSFNFLVGFRLVCGFGRIF